MSTAVIPEKKTFTWEPQEGPQSEFYYSSADECFYGGAAGGGKALTPDHEVLTSKGWVPIAEIEIGHNVLAWDQKQEHDFGSLVYATVQGVYAQDYNGEILEHENRPYFRASPDHRWIVSWDEQRPKRKCCWKVVRSTDLGPGIHIPAVGGSVPIEAKTYAEREAEHELMGWYIAEGCRLGDSARFSPTKPVGRARIAELLQTAEIKFRERKQDIVAEWNPEYCGDNCYTKFIPRSYLISAYERPTYGKALLRGLVGGDGTPRRKGWEYYTASQQLADGVQELGTLLGYRTVIYPKKTNYQPALRPPKKGKGSVKLAQNWRVCGYPKRSWSLTGSKLNWVHYRGKMHCLWVPGPGNYFARYKGTVFVTGNSDGILGIAFSQVDHPYYKALILRRTLSELAQEGGLIERSHQLLRGIAHYNSQKHVWKFPSGAGIQFGYCESEFDVHRYQGSNYAFVGWEELTGFTEYQYRTINGYIRNPGFGLHKIVRATSNPGRIGHAWVKAMFIDKLIPYKIYRVEKTGLTRQFIPAKVWDNKILLANDPDYIKRLKGMPEPWRTALLEGNWNIFTGQGFPEWDYKLHTCEPFELESWWPRVIAIDWGYSKPYCAISFAVTDAPQALLYREAYGTKQLPPRVAERIIREHEGEPRPTIVLDRSCWAKTGATRTIAEQFDEVFQKVGWTVEPSDSDRLSGKLLVHEFLRTEQAEPVVPRPVIDNHWMERFRNEGEEAVKEFEAMGIQPVLPRMLIFRKGILNRKPYGCPNLIRTLPTLVLDEDNPDDVDTEQEDHCLVAGTMVETETGQRPMESIKAGEKVLTRNGFRPVLRSWLTQQTAKVFQVEFSNGQHLVGTGAHPVWVAGRGFSRIDSLGFGDIIALCESRSSQPPFKSLRERDTISADNTSGERGNYYTAKSGMRSTEKSRQVRTSTTKTATEQTTKSGIFNPFLEKLICLCRESCVVIATVIWKPFDRWLQNGTKAQREEDGIGNMPEKSGKTGKLLQRLAQIVRNHSVRFSENLLSIVGVPIYVSPNGVEEIGLILLRNNAAFAGVSSKATSTTEPRPVLRNAVHVCGIYPAGIATVYNLTVDQDHEYYANGILVSNCYDSLRYGLKRIGGAGQKPLADLLGERLVNTDASTRHIARGLAMKLDRRLKLLTGGSMKRIIYHGHAKNRRRGPV